MNDIPLAICGAPPRFENPLHVGRPNIGDEDVFISRVKKILDDKWLTNNGPFVREFEERIEKRLGVKHCVAFCNGTVALEVAIRAMGLNGEVIVPSFTFVASAHALKWQQIDPIFCDIKTDTYCIDPDEIERYINSKTTAILGVHTFGRICEIEKLTALANKNNLKLFFDASHAFGCTHNGISVGNFGECETFSFHATKCLNTLEGGAVVTNNTELSKKLRLMKNFGFDGIDSVVSVGINGKMNEVSAAMGLSNLERFDLFVEANAVCYQIYEKCLMGIPGIKLIRYDLRQENNFHYVVIEVDQEILGFSRDFLVEVLWAENILARRYFYPGCHRMEPYRSDGCDMDFALPHTIALCEKVVALPSGPSLSEMDILKVCEVIKIVIDNAGEVLRSRTVGIL